ncbi:CaiB/BaiF CoA transferase family protein [Streptomyces sp. NPDC055078]
MTVLRDIQVVDLSTGIAGPVVGMFLADFGAEVVKVEPPEGDPARSLPGFAVWNRGKKSMVVDPAVPEQCSRLEALLGGADVCVVRDAGVLRAHGLDPDRLRRTNPGLVIVEVPPYATGGETPWTGGEESHGLLAAASGVAWRQSCYDGGPVESVLPQFLYVQGLWAMTCTAAALLERERSGTGQRVTVTGLNAVMQAAVSLLTVNAGVPDPSTAVGPAGRHPTYTRHRAGDGEWLGCGGLGVKFETALIRAIGLGEMLDEREGGMPRLLAPENLGRTTRRISEAFLTRDRDEWLKIFGSLGIPCGPLDDPSQWLDQEQIQAIGMREEVTDPERGTVTMPGVPLRLTRSPGAVAGPAPALGGHQDEVRARAPRPADTRGWPRLVAGPLSGLRVLNMGTFVAGPYAGHLLAELGADVIKVEPIQGDPFRSKAFTYNRGMRSLALDLSKPAGKSAFHRLAAVSDVVVNSSRPGVAARLGVDHPTLSSVNPGIVTVSLSGYGEVGAMAAEPAVDMVVQAMSGMMKRQGGDSEPVANTIALVDTTSAVMTALAAVLSLLHRERTGEGQHAWTSLAGTATFLQSGELVRYRDRPEPSVGGRDHRGTDPFDRFYPVSDGWIRLHANSSGAVSARRLASAGLNVDEAELAADPAAALTAALREHTGRDAAQALNEAGVPAVRARRISEVLSDEQLLADEFSHIRPGADGITILAPGRYATFSRTQRFGPLPVAGTGERTREVLREAGLDESEIAALAEAGTVVEGGPMEQRLTPVYR